MPASTRYYVIGTKYGRSTDMLPLMVEEGVVATGFSSDFNLGKLIGKEPSYVDRELRKRLPDEGPTGIATLRRLSAMRPGDLIALKAHSAPRGKRARLVIARYAVVRGDLAPIYRLIPRLGHSIEVDFLPSQEAIEFEYGYGQTLHEIEGERIGDIFGSYALAEVMRHDPGDLRDKATHKSSVSAKGDYVMTRIHNEIQNSLKSFLVQTFGKQAVSQELDGMDLGVEHLENFFLIEIKSSPSATTCIREALGQMLHYASKLRFKASRIKFIVVGPLPAGQSDTRLIDYVRRSTGLDLGYMDPSGFRKAMRANMAKR